MDFGPVDKKKVLTRCVSINRARVDKLELYLYALAVSNTLTLPGGQTNWVFSRKIKKGSPPAV